MAIAILAVVLTTIYMSYISTMRVVKSLEQGDTVYNMARITLERMVLDLESACKVNDAFEFVAIRDDSAKLPLKGISFLSRAHLDFSRAGQTMAVATIRYELEPDEQAGAFSIVRRDNLKSGGSSGGEGFALCRGLQSMNLRFFDKDGREYPFWDSRSGGGAQQNNIPAAITIELSFLNADDRSRPYKFMTKLLLTGARKT